MNQGKLSKAQFQAAEGEIADLRRQVREAQARAERAEAALREAREALADVTGRIIEAWPPLGSSPAIVRARSIALSDAPAPAQSPDPLARAEGGGGGCSRRAEAESHIAKARQSV